MHNTSKRFTVFLTSCLAFAIAFLAVAPAATLAQNATPAPTGAATMAATMAGTGEASALPAACGNTPGTIRDLAAKIKADPTKKVKIGFLFVGSVDDFGYNYAANQGRLCLEAVYPGSTVKEENVPENAEAE